MLTVWEPSETLIDSVYVEAMRLLLGNGLGDPRGCRFGRFTVSYTTHSYVYFGWVSSDGTRMVHLSGVEGPVLHLFEEIRSEEIWLAIAQGGPFTDWGPTSANHGREPGRAAVLLLVGRTAEAETVYGQILRHCGNGENAVKELFSELIIENKKLLGDALKGRRDREGLGIAQTLQRLTSLELSVVYFKPPRTGYEVETEYELANSLVNDFELRLANPHPAPDLDAIDLLPIEERVSVLTDLLPELDLGESPLGEINYEWNEWLNRFIKIGDPAVPVLIDAFDKYPRFTRTAHPRKSTRMFEFVKVPDLIEQLLPRLWKGASKAWNAETRHLDPNALREYWNRESDLSPAMRNLQTLRDDDVSGENWLSAARELTDPIVVAYDRYVPVFGPMKGEALREEFGEEIVELLRRRSRDLLTRSGGGARNSWDALYGLRLANRMAMWDLQSSLGALQEACANLSEMYVNGAHHGLARSISVAIRFRSQLGDETVGEDFLRLLRLSIRHIQCLDLEIFNPLWNCPEDGYIQQAGQEAFAMLSARSVEDFVEIGHIARAMLKGVRTPLIRLGSFRELLTQWLVDERHVFNSVSVHSGDRIQWEYRRFGEPSPEYRRGAAAWTDIPASVADYLAEGITSWRPSEFGAYDLRWTAEEKDAAKVRLRGKLLDESLPWDEV